MTIPFSAYCVFTVVLAILAIAGIGPLLWDAVGYVEEILNQVYNLEAY